MERFLKPQNDLLSRQGSIKIKALIIKLFCSYMSYYSSLTERLWFLLKLITLVIFLHMGLSLITDHPSSRDLLFYTSLSKRRGCLVIFNLIIKLSDSFLFHSTWRDPFLLNRCFLSLNRFLNMKHIFCHLWGDFPYFI